MPSVSVIIGTYNYLDYLKLCMRGLERQTFTDFEVIVADDGSGPELGRWLEGYNPPFPVKHLWQEDKGFRKCRILNRAILEGRGEYVVFLDADCIVARDFLATHWEGRKKGVFLGGRRVMMDRSTSEKVTPDMIDRGYFDGVTLWGLYHSVRGDFKYYEETFRWLGTVRGKTRFSLLGSNFSIHRSDLYRVNGFDEDYESRGGGEDTDISHRLRAVGCVMGSVRYRALEFHLGHEKPEDKSASERLFTEKKKRVMTPEDARNVRSILAGKRDPEGGREARQRDA